VQVPLKIADETRRLLSQPSVPRITGFHEKAGDVNASFWSLQQKFLIADQQEARRLSRPFLSFTFAESPRFHPHS
jgi:hypothetical protein